MIKTRLLKMLKEGTKYVGLEIVWQLLGLVAQVIIVGCVARIISRSFYATLGTSDLLIYLGVSLFAIFCKLVFNRLYTESSFRASAEVKTVIRQEIYNKLLSLGSSYREKVSTAQISQMMSEGVEQLEVYFGKYISQFVYALIAPICLFIFLSQYNSKAATILLVAVPLIPIVIMIVMKVAKKLLDKYFQIYYSLGDTFLEKLHGLTTLKIYQADQNAAEEMDAESEHFRKITMKVLSMQLNSTIIMDIIAYGGAALGIATTLKQYSMGKMTLEAAIMFLLLSAEFFLPMRLLGSYFHIGMNGMKSADKIFEFLDLKEAEDGKLELEDGPHNIMIRGLGFSYGKNPVLKDINMDIPAGSFVSIVGKSGSGKSTIAGILRKQNRKYQGAVFLGDKELKKISEQSLMSAVTTVSLDSYVFPGTVRENLLLGNPKTKDAKLIKALQLMNLWKELEQEGGLELVLKEGGTNISGGQRQRLCLARALLKNSPIYIFDEATSNIDMESEEIIMKVINKMSKDLGKTVILISHRMANVVKCDKIFLLEQGQILESGNHKQLMENNGYYAKIYASQRKLEKYGEVSANEE